MAVKDWLRDWRALVALGALSVLLVYYVFPLLLYLVFLLLMVVLGGFLALLHHPGPYVRRSKTTLPKPPGFLVQPPLSRIKPYPPPHVKPTLLSAMVDIHLQEVIDLTLKHHVIPTYKMVGLNQKAFFHSVMPEIWQTLGALFKRAGQMDTMKLITQDVAQALKSHFEQFRGIHYQDTQQDPAKFPNLSVFPYLESPEHELNYLRQLSEVLLCSCLSRDLLECPSVRVLIREYLSCQILQPTIEMLCDPDYINQRLLVHLTKREDATKSARKRPAYTDFEDFMKHISKSEDLNELQQIRESIITDIIQAKAVFKMRSSRITGLQGRQFPIPIPAEKVKSLMDRDLDVYITQLGTAKAVCERQIRKQGGDDYTTLPVSTDMFLNESSSQPLGIPFETIMKNDIARMYLFRFMDVCGFGSFIIFWVSVGDLSDVPQSSVRKHLKAIYEEHLSPVASGCLYVEASILEAILGSMESDTQVCVSLLRELQAEVYDEIYELFYQNFIFSDYYKELMQQGNEGVFSSLEGFPEGSGNESLEDSQYKQKLHSLKSRLEEKDNELLLMPEAVRSSRSLVQRKKALEKDRSHLSDEIKKLEHYIDHTEEWFGTIGQWSIEIHSVDVSKEDGNDQDPMFVIVVHRPEFSRKTRKYSNSTNSTTSLDDLNVYQAHSHAHSAILKRGDSFADSEDGIGTASEISENGEGSQAGWVVGRHLSEFINLHDKVSPVCIDLKFPPLPKRYNPFSRHDAQSNYWAKYCQALQCYLSMVMQNDRLQESEEVFNFLSPVSDNLRKSSLIPYEKRTLSNRLSLNVTLLQGLPVVGKLGGSGKDHSEEGGVSGAGSGGGGKEDSIAEHMYLLVSEVFELDQWSRVLRKQLVELVQLTYGKSIDRQLQEFMSWVVSEPMLIFYLEMFRDSMWPGGKPAPPSPTRSDTEKTHTRDEAKKKFLKSSPQALQTILGQRNCQIGLSKIFESLQDARGNKQLFYSLLEILLYALVPELTSVDIDDNGQDWRVL